MRRGRDVTVGNKEQNAFFRVSLIYFASVFVAERDECGELTASTSRYLELGRKIVDSCRVQNLSAPSLLPLSPLPRYSPSSNLITSVPSRTLPCSERETTSLPFVPATHFSARESSMSSANNDKVALVTGSSRGIGRGIALRLAVDGFTVVVNDISANSKGIDSVVQEIEATGRKAFGIVCGEF